MRWMGGSIAGLVVMGCSERVAPTGDGSESGESTATATSSESSGPMESSSTSGEPDDPCMLVPDPGQCDAAFPRWYFDPATQRCTEFTWGGCDGVVPFEDATTCSLACESCETQRAPATPTTVTVTIANETTTPIYVEAAQPDPMDAGYFRRQEYVLEDDASGEILASHANACDSAFSCTQVDAADECACDPGPPYQPGAIRIDPGGVYEATSWSSLVWIDGSIGSECVDPGCGTFEGPVATCRRQVPYLGTFVVARARASTALDGDDCDASAEGWCETGAGATPVDPTFEAQTGFDFPTSAVELVFSR